MRYLSYMQIYFRKLLILLILIFPLSNAGGPNGNSYEVTVCLDPKEKGIVTSVESGNTIVVDTIGKIKFAGVFCPNNDSEDGNQAKKYTESLINQQVYLDYYRDVISDQILAVVFLSNPDGTLDKSAIFNRMIVDNRYGEYSDNIDTSIMPNYSTWSTEWPYCEKQVYHYTV